MKRSCYIIVLYILLSIIVISIIVNYLNNNYSVLEFFVEDYEGQRKEGTVCFSLKNNGTFSWVFGTASYNGSSFYDSFCEINEMGEVKLSKEETDYLRDLLICTIKFYSPVDKDITCKTLKGDEKIIRYKNNYYNSEFKKGDSPYISFSYIYDICMYYESYGKSDKRRYHTKYKILNNSDLDYCMLTYDNNENLLVISKAEMNHNLRHTTIDGHTYKSIYEALSHTEDSRD